MLKATIVTTEDELMQIHQLNQQNLKSNLNAEEQKREGFVTWLYPMDLLMKMHQLSAGIIVKDEERVVAYALTTLKKAKEFHNDLQIMFDNLQAVRYHNRPLASYSFYCMGQICVAKEYRGKGIVNMLYQKHKEVYESSYDFLLTEISTANPRSMKAHKRIGFKTIYTYTDAMDEWNVVVWDWK